MTEDIERLIRNLNRELEKADAIGMLKKKVDILKAENEQLRAAAAEDCGHEPHIESLRGRIKELEAEVHGLRHKLMQIQQEFDA